MAIILSPDQLTALAGRLNAEDLEWYMTQMKNFYLNHIRNKEADIGDKLGTRMKASYRILETELDSRPPEIGME